MEQILNDIKFNLDKTNYKTNENNEYSSSLLTIYNHG